MSDKQVLPSLTFQLWVWVSILRFNFVPLETLQSALSVFLPFISTASLSFNSPNSQHIALSIDACKTIDWFLKPQVEQNWNTKGKSNPVSTTGRRPHNLQSTTTLVNSKLSKTTHSYSTASGRLFTSHRLNHNFKLQMFISFAKKNESFNIYPNVQNATQILTLISKTSSTLTCLSKEKVKISCPKTEAGLYAPLSRKGLIFITIA